MAHKEMLPGRSCWPLGAADCHAMQELGTGEGARIAADGAGAGPKAQGCACDAKVCQASPEPEAKLFSFCDVSLAPSSDKA